MHQWQNYSGTKAPRGLALWSCRGGCGWGGGGNPVPYSIMYATNKQPSTCDRSMDGHALDELDWPCEKNHYSRLRAAFFIACMAELPEEVVSGEW